MDGIKPGYYFIKIKNIEVEVCNIRSYDGGHINLITFTGDNHKYEACELDTIEYLIPIPSIEKCIELDKTHLNKR